MVNAKAKALKNRMDGVKKAVINKVSDVLSAPARAYYGLKASRANSEAKVLRTARSYDNAPDFDDRGMPTDAFKYRSVAEGIKDKYRRKANKK